MVEILVCGMVISLLLGALTWLFITAVRGSADMAVKTWRTSEPEREQVRP